MSSASQMPFLKSADGVKALKQTVTNDKLTIR